MDGECVCELGLTACGSDCVDIASDPQHCGSCGAPCSPGVACVEGACGDSIVALGGTEVSTVEVSAGSPDTTCTWHNEAYPELSAWAGDAEFFGGHNRTVGSYNYNWGYQWNLWGLGAWIPAPVGHTYKGDPWATTSGLTGLNYVSYLANNGVTNVTAIAAGYPDDIDNGIWEFTSIVDPEVSDSDGPAMHFDPSSDQLWVVDVDLGDSEVQLYSFHPCTGGAPGSASCPLRAGPIIVQSGGNFGHANVITNPCTDHAIVAYRTLPDSAGYHQIWLGIYDSAGTLIDTKKVATGLRWERNDQCPDSTSGCVGFPNPHPGYICKCEGPESGGCRSPSASHSDWDCMRWFPRVHMSVRGIWPAECRLAIGYDDTAQASDGHNYFKSHYQIYNIEDETDFTHRVTLDSNPDSTPGNDFGGLVSFNEFSASFGFFFYRQRFNDPCDTAFVGRADESYGEGAMPMVAAIGHFPTFSWLGDYVGIVRRGLPGGYLFATWAEPIITSGGSPCPMCLGDRWSNRIRGVRVHP